MESERILGQNHILRHFENAIRMGKISHAYIINGEEGSGKMNLAIHFAKALQCERNNSNKAINEDGERITVPGTACGQCKSCKQTDSKNQPDIKYITYEKSGIGVDEIREQINDDIDIKPYSSPYKIYIVPESEKMTVQAQNTAAAKNAATKVTTEENASEYNPANVKPIDKIDQTTAVVENAQGKEQSNTSADPKGEQQQHVTNEQIKKAVEKLNKNMMSHSEAVFGIHEATNRVTIKIIDKDTKKVIKELPPEKTLDMIAKVWELAGILVDEKR